MTFASVSAGSFPRKIDQRIEKLVVAIAKSKELLTYFFDDSKMHLACRYLGIPHPHLRRRNLDQASDFLYGLYFRDPEKFRELIQYVLNEIVEKYRPRLIVSKKPFGLADIKEVFDGFDRFLKELNVLGFNYDYDKSKVVSTVGHKKEDTQIKTVLDEMLDKLNPKYCNMLEGSWESFMSDNKDKNRQTLTSLRELTRMVIDQLAPKETTRKNRIRRIIASEKEEELTESLVDTIAKLQDLHSKNVHTKPDYDSTLFALKITEYLLFFLLKKAGINR